MNTINIKVLGTGCSTCMKLCEIVQEAIKLSNRDCELEKINDVEKIFSLGVRSTPALLINNEIQQIEEISSIDDIIKMIDKY